MPMQSQHFSSPQIRSGRHFLNSCNALAAVYTYILHLCCSKFTQKVVPSLHKPITRYMCTLLCRYMYMWMALCMQNLVVGQRWSRWAGSRSPRRLICTKSSMHGISVIKIRRSLTTGIVKSSFHCKQTDWQRHTNTDRYCTCIDERADWWREEEWMNGWRHGWT